MSKHLILEEIEKLKEAHLKWVEKAREIVESGSIKNVSAPVSDTECAFGKLIHSGLLDNIDEDIKYEIETAHFLVHDTYHNIFNLFDGKEVLSEDEKNQAQAIFEILDEVSKELMGSVDHLK
jgi:hypothetical protein